MFMSTIEIYLYASMKDTSHSIFHFIAVPDRGYKFKKCCLDVGKYNFVNGTEARNKDIDR